MKRLAPPALAVTVAFVGVSALLVPGVALACPSCAGRDGGGAAYLLSMAAMIAFPFAVVAVLVPLIRRGSPGPKP